MAFKTSLVEGTMHNIVKLVVTATVMLSMGCQETPAPAPITDTEALTAALETAAPG